jgi:hypothetical protein
MEANAGSRRVMLHDPVGDVIELVRFKYRLADERVVTLVSDWAAC